MACENWRHKIGVQIHEHQHFDNKKPEKPWNPEHDHLSSEFITWDKLDSFCDVMIWRHDVTVSYKWESNDNFELSDLKTIETKKELSIQHIYKLR